MTLLECCLVFAAGVCAGTINAIVGSGTLLTFPVLLAVGYSPVVANVSNTLGLVPGAISGAIGYRAELRHDRRPLIVLGIAATLGGITGATLLLSLGGSAFEAVVPVLIVLALVLIIAQPRIAKAFEQSRRDTPKHTGPLLSIGVYGTGIYGGYFGAAQGVILLALTGIADPDDIQRANALKNVLAALINGVAAVIFAFAATVAWLPVALLAVGSTIGGQLGARIGRRLSPKLLRAVTVAVGGAAVVYLLT